LEAQTKRHRLLMKSNLNIRISRQIPHHPLQSIPCKCHGRGRAGSIDEGGDRVETLGAGHLLEEVLAVLRAMHVPRFEYSIVHFSTLIEKVRTSVRRHRVFRRPQRPNIRGKSAIHKLRNITRRLIKIRLIIDHRIILRKSRRI
jgi:hypothetical protein